MTETNTLHVPYSQTEEPFLAGGGKMGALMRTFDWASSPLGPVSGWPLSLRMAVSLCLDSQFPTVIFWGPDLVMLYNDAYLPMLADKHPVSLGRAAREVWPEIWSIVGPMLHGVLETGEATWSYDLLLPIIHNGAVGEHYFTFSYSPIRDETGKVCGVFCPVTETTHRLQSERREQRLRAEAEQARDDVTRILESMGDRFVAFDPQWRITYANASAAEFMHHRREDLLGKNYWEEFPPVLGTNIEREFRRAMAERVVVEFETYYAPWARWAEAHVFPLRDGGIAVFFRDITERKQAEQALQESEERLRLATDFAEVGIWQYYVQEDRLLWSPQFKRLFGLIPDDSELTYEKFLTYVHPRDLDRMNTVVRQVIEEGRDLDIEYRIIWPDGSVHWIAAKGRALHDDTGKTVRFMGVAFDVTARKQAEEVLRQQAQIMDQVRDSVIVTDLDGFITSWNKGAERLFGYTAQEMLGQHLRVTYPEDEQAILQDQVIAPFQAKGEHEIEVRRRRKSGEDVYVHLSLSLLRDERGVAVGAIGYSTDITARKQAEEAQARLMVELQRINDELQQFAHIVSHDLNEPLRTMSSFVTLLAREYKGKLDATADEYIAFVTDGAQRMQSMITDLLAYTQAGGQDLTSAQVDCEAMLVRVLTGLQVAITDAKAEVTHDPLPTVQGDVTRLGQVLQNLIGNALKFRSPAPPRIHISAQRDGSHWRFSVRDNGIGIDPRQVARLFQVFRRLHTRSEYPGTGMGLAICKKIVERHGGRIWVESKPSEGAIFYFTIGQKDKRDKG